MTQLFIKKPLKVILNQAEEGERGLKRTLTPFSLIMMGIGAIIGAGLFIKTASAAADNAGPSVTIGFILAGLGCAFAGLCYAEFASKIPIAGSAYTYSYAILGELVAWIIGWDLILEYALGAATVAIAWSQYFNKLLGFITINGIPLAIPDQLCHSPFESFMNASQVMEHGIMNIPALLSVILISLLLIRGISGSAFVNNVIVFLKVAIVILFIILGWPFMDPSNHTPFIPPPSVYVDPSGITHDFGGLPGILGAAGVVFFAFIGFDAVSTAAQETINPKRAMPIGILGSLIVCTVLYILFSYVLTGIASTEDFRYAGKEASVTYVIETYMTGYGWLAKLVTLAILIGLSSVLLVLLMAQSRVFYSMSRDGLLPKMFSDIHTRFRTPYKSNILFVCVVGFLAAFVPGPVVGNMTSIGTLFAFTLVCAGIIMLRRSNFSENSDQFKTPFVPFVPIMGILICGIMIISLGTLNWIRLIVWMGIGLVIYFSYGRFHSHMQTKNQELKPPLHKHLDN
ncbi:amino acid permease [Criblamydia sequanensis]|uniref:Amino acid transporter n=1 Tax=Candidatus Criblamydia sequanensis CRIB-18 TaxID=1437425 RepID=A0A090D1A9_9BACT|nr:amino acid permease [Criblamydia sequanensis]CDR35161.1 Amino acid transporter [Criblamydia sequanensis CRIB-18]